MLKEHLEVIENECEKINGKNLRRSLVSLAVEILNQVDEGETVYAGTIYSIVARKKK